MLLFRYIGILSSVCCLAANAHRQQHSKQQPTHWTGSVTIWRMWNARWLISLHRHETYVRLQYRLIKHCSRIRGFRSSSAEVSLVLRQPTSLSGMGPTKFRLPLSSLLPYSRTRSERNSIQLSRPSSSGTGTVDKQNIQESILLAWVYYSMVHKPGKYTWFNVSVKNFIFRDWYTRQAKKIDLSPFSRDEFHLQVLL
jgi:hypothetical protein